MKKCAAILLVLIAFTACSEEFESKDPTAFNEKIAERTDILSPEALIEIYYNYPKTETPPLLTIKSKSLSKDKFSITLIHDKQQDDSQRAIKIVLSAQLKERKWEVKEIKINRKCWEGRGHTNWGIEWCK